MSSVIHNVAWIQAIQGLYNDGLLDRSEARAELFEPEEIEEEEEE